MEARGVPNVDQTPGRDYTLGDGGGVSKGGAGGGLNENANMYHARPRPVAAHRVGGGADFDRGVCEGLHSGGGQFSPRGIKSEDPSGDGGQADFGVEADVVGLKPFASADGDSFWACLGEEGMS